MLVLRVSPMSGAAPTISSQQSDTQCHDVSARGVNADKGAIYIDAASSSEDRRMSSQGGWNPRQLGNRRELERGQYHMGETISDNSHANRGGLETLS